MLKLSLIGKEYREFEGEIDWKLNYEGMTLLILKPRRKFGRDVNFVGIAEDLKVKWELGGRVSDPDAYDGIVNVWIKDGQLRAGTSTGFAYRINHETGEILEEAFNRF